MFLPPPFIGASINVAVSLQLTSACIKLVYSLYRIRIGGVGLGIWPCSPSFWDSPRMLLLRFRSRCEKHVINLLCSNRLLPQAHGCRQGLQAFHTVFGKVGSTEACLFPEGHSGIELEFRQSCGA